MPSAGIVIVEALLNPKPETQPGASINGYVIGRGSAHAIAIHERNGVSWVAEFRDGRGELMNANTWFYFHAERLGYWNRRQAYKSVQPLPPPMLEAIERLHREREAREAATVTRRCKITLAEAAARLHRALETVPEADDRNERREQATPPRARTSLQRLNSLMSATRSFFPRTNRTVNQMDTSEKALMASRIRSVRRARSRHLDVTLVAFTIAAALVAWLLVMDMPAQPSPLVPFFTTMAGSSSIG